MATPTTSRGSHLRPRWSFRLGTVAGIPIRVHVTLLLLLAWIAASYWLSGIGVRASAIGVVMFVVVFAIIVVHELGHALLAKHFGVRTHEILLLPIGGIASLERIPERPRHELAVALVGPAINLAIAAVLWLGLVVTGGSVDPTASTSMAEAFGAQLLWINVVLAAFNLLPAFPLDGGRALRAVLSLRMERERATSIAASAGKGLAIVLGVLGIFVNLWLVVIAFVIWIGAQRERELIRIRSSLAGVAAHDLMSHLRSAGVELADTIGTAASRMLDTGSGVLPVVDHGRLVAAITSNDLADAMRHAGPDAPIAVAPHHEVVRVVPDAPLDKVLDDLQARPEAVAVVVENGIPVGLITPDQLATYVAFHPSIHERSTTA